MVLDGLRGYLQLANGLTEVTRERARGTAKALVEQGGASVGSVLPTSVRSQVSSLTDDLLATSKANRNLLINLVRGEVERTVGRMGLASAQELHAAGRRVKALERRVGELEDDVRAAPAPRKRTAKKATAKKTGAKKASPRKRTAKKAAPSAAAPEPATAAAETAAPPAGTTAETDTTTSTTETT